MRWTPAYLPATALSALVAALLVAGCGSDGGKPWADPASSGGGGNAAASDTIVLKNDPLHIGDRIHIDFNANTGAPIPPVETDIKGDGMISLQFVGRVMADNKTPGQLEKDIEALYVPAYYKEMTVSVTPVSRFFYVGGEVSGGSGGGRVVYTGPITVTQAINSAGGFTPFANKHTVELRRFTGKIYKIDCLKALRHPELDLPVYPNDSITVYRRLY